MVTPLQATPQIEADKRLAQFTTYEEYLDSLLTKADWCYLQSETISRTIAELGYRNSGETLTRGQFEKRVAAVMDYLYPKFKPYVMASHEASCPDLFHKELQIRERSNRLGIMATIIFLRHYTKNGFEVSGYIDFGERLVNTNLRPVFQGQALLTPRPGDLGFFHWRTDKSRYNDSMNFKAVIHPRRGLLFQNRYDRKVICVDPQQLPGNNSVSVRVQTRLYDNAIIYDHLVMQRM